MNVSSICMYVWILMMMVELPIVQTSACNKLKGHLSRVASKDGDMHLLKIKDSNIFQYFSKDVRNKGLL